jgi:hypothetical protein
MIKATKITDEELAEVKSLQQYFLFDLNET